MRFLLVMWLAAGLVPDLGEVAEAVVHLATSGHLVHSDADHGDLGHQGDEHGCGTTQHNCGCCASQVLLSTQASAIGLNLVAAPGPSVTPDALVSLHEPTPPFRPPIPS